MATRVPKKEEEPQLPMLATEDSFTAALRAAGFLSESSGGGFDINRIQVNGQNFLFDGDIIASYNPVTKEPALYVQIAGPITEYQRMFFDKDGALARAIDRPDRAGKMCKSHFDDPEEARRFSEVYNGQRASCDECPIHPFVPKDQLPEEAKGQKCSWKADIEFYILDKEADGTLVSNDKTLYTMTLPTTGVIEFKGSSSKKADSSLAGSISEQNFMVKLAKLGIEKWGEAGLLKAHTYYGLGGVIAEVRALPASSNDGAFKYNVISFNPIDILEMEEAVKLETSEAPEEPDSDDVPF